MFRKRVIVVTSLALLALAATCLLDLIAPFAYRHAANALRDAIARGARKAPANPDLVFLAIDSESVNLEDDGSLDEIYRLDDPTLIEARALHAMSKSWPWPREVYALVLQRLVEAGAQVVLFDLTFPMATAGDEPLRLALEKYRDHVVVGSNFVSADKAGGAAGVVSYTRPPETLIPAPDGRDDRIGYTNFWPDDDDVVRRAQYRITDDEARGLPRSEKSHPLLSLGASALVKSGLAARVPKGTGDRIFRYTAPPRKGFPPHSLIEIFDPESWRRNFRSGEFFRGKIVLVGAEGNWQHDEHATPFGSMPGPELHLNAINAAIHGDFIREIPRGAVPLLALLAAALAVALSLAVGSPWLRLLLVAAIDCAAVSVALYVFNGPGIYLPVLPFLLALNSTVLLALVCDFGWERVERARVRKTLEKYVSNNVVRELLDHPDSFQQSLGGVVKPAAILFSDIRGYTTVSARTDPQALVTQLNEYLSAMVECVFRYGGTLDKFIGDAVMAVWGNVQSEGATNDAANAVRAALAMREELARLNADWRRRGLNELRIGVAINQGDVVVGNVGSPQRMEFTVIGDAVNVSWRLQELTKQVQTELVVSKSVAALVVEHFELQSLGRFPVAGLSETVEIFGISQPITEEAEAALASLEVGAALA